VIRGESSFQTLETSLRQCDLKLAQGAVKQAENELPKGDPGTSSHLALENVRKQLEAGEITPIRARHEVKQVMRHHS
jgi:hypothetical protein